MEYRVSACDSILNITWHVVMVKECAFPFLYCFALESALEMSFIMILWKYFHILGWEQLLATLLHFCSHPLPPRVKSPHGGHVWISARLLSGEWHFPSACRPPSTCSILYSDNQYFLMMRIKHKSTQKGIVSLTQGWFRVVCPSSEGSLWVYSHFRWWELLIPQAFWVITTVPCLLYTGGWI